MESLASRTSSAALQLRFAQNDNAGFLLTLNASTVQLFKASRVTSICPFAPGTGTPRNRNCPAYRNLRRFAAKPVDVPRCAKTVSGAGHFQRDVSQRSRGGDLIIVPAAFRIRSKDECSMSSDICGRVRPKMETARLPGCRRHANRRLAPSPLATLQSLACNGNSKTDAQVFERNR